MVAKPYELRITNPAREAHIKTGRITQSGGQRTRMNEWLPGTILANKYEIVKELGRGGFGVTYLVRHLHLDGEVRVLKRLHESHSKQPDFCQKLSQRSEQASETAELPQRGQRSRFGGN